MSSRAWVFGAVLLGAGAMAAAGLAQTMDGRRGGAYAIIGPECMATGLSFREPSAEVKLDRSRRGTSFDGGGGIDTFALAGPAFSVLHADRFRSLERVDTVNGLFDFVAIKADMVLTAELAEVEVITDWFDTIVLDPAVEWTRSTDEAYTGLIFTAEHRGKPVRVRTGFEAAIVEPNTLPLVTTEGPVGRHARIGSDAIEADPETPRYRDARRRWSEPGIVMPDLAVLSMWGGQIELDLDNGEANILAIDMIAMHPERVARVDVVVDDLDRLVLMQSGCFGNAEDVPDTAKAELRTISGAPSAIVLRAPRAFLETARTRPFTTAVPGDAGGFAHLTADADRFVDQIDLSNGSRDVLMVRNDVRLRHGAAVPVLGDPGLDEIWLAGTAGWEIEYTDRGIVASSYVGADGPIRLAFAPGLSVHRLAVPRFLSDRRLETVSAYPGIRDTTSRSTRLFVTRGGYVRFSSLQIDNATLLDMTNGIANTFELRPDLFAVARGRVVLRGDAGMDSVMPVGMPAFTLDEEGNARWQIERDGGEPLEIVAEGLRVLALSHDPGAGKLK